LPFNLDIPTVIILIAFASLLQACLIIAFAFLVNEYKGLAYGVAGNLCLAFGYILIITRDVSPNWLSIIISNELLLAGIIFFYMALRKFTALPINRYLVIALPIICLLSLYYFTYQDKNMAMRIITMSVLIVPVIVAGIITLLFSDHKKYQISVFFIIIPAAIYGIILVIRAINAWYDPPQTIFSNTLTQIINYTMLFVTNISWTAGFVNMNSQRLQSDLRESANTDILTGLPNRRAALAFLKNEFARQSRNEDYFFSILIIDLDLFKEINDQFGHDTGDFVLIKMATIFRDMIRTQDHVARWGGDEFIIIMPQTRSCEAYALGKRLIEHINLGKFLFNQTAQKWTVSIGVSESAGCKDIDDILKKADIALYQSKHTRNAITQEAS